MKKIIAILLAVVFLCPSIVFARGGVSSGGRSGGFSSSRSSYSSYSSSRSSYSSPSVSRSSSSSSVSRSATSGTSSRSTGSSSLKSLFGGSSTAKSASTTPSSSTKTTKTSSGKTGYVVDDNYKPRFFGGYTAPSGSVIVYRDSSILDWLPFYMIMNSNNAHREATITQPDGETKVIKEEGVDGMYIMNWIISILFIGGIIGGIVYLVNKYTNKKEEEYYV